MLQNPSHHLPAPASTDVLGVDEHGAELDFVFAGDFEGIKADEFPLLAGASVAQVSRKVTVPDTWRRPN